MCDREKGEECVYMPQELSFNRREGRVWGEVGVGRGGGEGGSMGRSGSRKGRSAGREGRVWGEVGVGRGGGEYGEEWE